MVTPLAPGHSDGRMRQLTAARLVNLFPEASPEGARSPLVVHGTPGLKAFATCGSGPLRKAVFHQNYIYLVSGGSVYRVDSAGTATLCAGSVSASGLVTMQSNGTDIVIVIGGSAWKVNATSVSASGILPYTPGTIAFVDGYFIFTRQDTGQFFISGLYDAESFDATEFATAEARPDNLVRAFDDHRELWLFGAETTEVWSNVGGADFPFARIDGAVLERGLAAAGAVAKADNTVYWLGDDKIIYMANGYVPNRVSTHAEEEAIRDMSSVSDCVAFVERTGGHTFVIFKFPAGGRTFVYDAATKRWHERQSGVQDTAVWRVNDVIHAWGREYALDDWSGNLFELDMDTYTEGGSVIRRVARTPPLASQTDKFMRVHALQFIMSAGEGLLSGQGSDPQAMLRVSRDGGRTFGVELTRAIGPRGEYRQRAIWRRLGALRNGCFEIAITDPIKVSAAGIAVQAEELAA